MRYAWGGLRCTHMNLVIDDYYGGSSCESKILEEKYRFNKNSMSWYKDLLSLRIIALKNIMFKGEPN